MKFDIFLDDISLSENYGLRVLKYSISPPVAKTMIIDIPGTSDYFDLTESISGNVEYQMRTIKVTADLRFSRDQFFSVFSGLSNAITGKRTKIKFSWDPDFYWIGRVEFSDCTNILGYGGQIEMIATVEPYKYEINQQYPVALTLPQTVTLVGLHKHICPVFLCSNEMTVEYLGNTYYLNTGENQILEIFLGPGTHELNFSGTGTVTIDYQGASL